MSYDYDQNDHQPQGLSSGAKTAIGCGAVAFVFLALLCGGIIWGVYMVMDKAQEVVEQVVQELEKQADAFASRFEVEGYERVSGQTVDITTDIEQPTVFTCNVFQLNADSTADLAVMAQVAEINGSIDGDLHFLGQSLTIHPDAVITGDLHVQAQIVDNRGTVEGEVFQEELPGFNLPGPVPVDAPETKPAPGDVIDRPLDEAATQDGAAPAADTEPAENTESADDRSPADGGSTPPGDDATGDDAAGQNSPTGEP